MTVQLIKTLIQNLPRYAEEEGDFYSVTRDSLINALCQEHGIEFKVAENTVCLCERLLDALATLNADYLQNGEWCFVSFPAQLMACSVLAAMSDSGSRFFAANFWNTQGIAVDKKNQQREVLSAVENRRKQYHASFDAQPIRYIYVAWGIIKLDNNILLYQREDTQKRFDKQAGDYGLLGGRVNQNDLPIADKVAALTGLQSADADFIKQALPTTLKRELQEEAGLVFETHYTFTPWRSLKPYRQVQGTAPNYALTEYYLNIFQIKLTLEGYLFLQQQIKTDDRLTWFSIAELVSGASADGKIAYLKALYDDFTDDKAALESQLITLPVSFSSQYLFEPTKYGLTLPIDHSMPLLAGVLGKEKPMDLALTARHSAILLGLAAHLRGFEFASVEEAIVFHPFGWVAFQGNPSLQAELIDLANALKGTELIIENYRDSLFRLSIAPEVVYFDEKLFSFSVKQADMAGVRTKIPVTIHRVSFATAFGTVQAKTEVFELTLKSVGDLHLLSTRQHAADNDDAVRIEDAYKKGLHQEPRFLSLGLRSLIRREAGIVRFVIQYSNTK
ncbi:MAG: NUDIX hydrolase [Methylococcales bacterium]